MPASFPSLYQRFRAAVGLERKSTLASPEAWLLEAFGATPASSGVSATPRNAMQCAPVRCAVQAIAEAVGQLPVHVYSRDANGAKERDADHPAQKLLHDEANEWTPASELREQLTRDALLWGGGYAFINRVEGKPIELLRLDPAAVTVAADANTGEPIYRNGTTLIPRKNVLHIRAPGCDGVKGDSPVTQAREAIGLAIVMEQYAARLFGNGARPGGVISIKDKTIGPEGLAKVRAAFKAAHSPGKSGDTAILPAEAEWQPLTLTSVDAQFLELRAFSIAEIARVFRVPPVFLMDYGRATWSNSEQMGRQFLTFTLLPWIKRWEGEIRLKLFDADERASYVAEFLTDDLARADLSARMQAYSTAIAARILSPNEARAAENRLPYDGGDKFENPNTTAGSTT